MKNSYLRRLLDANRRLIEHKAFDSIRDHVHSETLWHLNRRSFASGLAVGFFAAFIPFPMQMLIAAVLAIALGANMPLALVATWISNPITYGPIFYFNYRFGRYLLEHITSSSQPLASDSSVLHQLHEIGLPLFFGSGCVALIVGLSTYFISRGIWRLWAIRKLLRRRSHRIQIKD